MKPPSSVVLGRRGRRLKIWNVLGDEPIGIEQQRQVGYVPSYVLHRQGLEAFGPRGEP